MAFIEQAHINDIGTVFRVTLNDTNANGTPFVANISAAILKVLYFRRPDGTGFERAAVFTTDGTDGRIEYSTIDGDLDQSGTWSIQAYVVMPGGRWNSSVANFRVYENIH